MSKLGLHVSAGNRRGFGELLAYCANANSPVAVVFSVDQDLWPDISGKSPSTLYIFRTKVNDDAPQNAYNGDAVQMAHDWMASQIPVWRMNQANYYAPLNELDPKPQISGDPLAHYKWFNDFCVECVNIAEANGFKLALPAFSVGNPPDENGVTRYEGWEQLLPLLRRLATGGHIVILHEYGEKFGTLMNSRPYHALRYRSALRFFAQYKLSIKVVISEASGGIGYTIDQKTWMVDAAAYDTELCLDRAVVGCCLYQLGGVENFVNILPQLEMYIVSHRTPALDQQADPCVAGPDTDPNGNPVPSSMPPAVAPPVSDDWLCVTGYPFASYGLLIPQIPSEATVREATARLLELKTNLYQSARDLQHMLTASRNNGLPGTVEIWEADKFPGGTAGLQSFFAESQAALIFHGTLGKHLDVPWKGQNTVRTDDDYSTSDCGPASLAMMLAYLGTDLSVDQVSIAAGLKPGFTSATIEDLQKAATSFGFTLQHHLNTITVDLIKSEIDAGYPVLTLVHYPSLPVRWDQGYRKGHFIVITGYAEGFSYLDPYWPTDANQPLPISESQLMQAMFDTYLDDNVSYQGATIRQSAAPGVITASGVGQGNRLAPTPTELEAIRLSGADHVLLLTMPNRDEQRACVRAFKTVTPYVVGRLFFSVDQGHAFTPAEFIDYCREGLRGMYDEGVRAFQIHNEPNLVQEGLGFAWTDGKAFGSWLLSVLSRLRAEFPGCTWGYPGLSPQPNTEQFFRDSKFAADQCDFVCVHAYWQSWSGGQWNAIDESGGMSWLAVARQTTKPLCLTEYSNNSKTVPYNKKGTEYHDYLERLRQQGRIKIAFAFALSWDQDSNNEAFVTGPKHDQLTAIPAAMKN
jgi:hypothetical protein